MSRVQIPPHPCQYLLFFMVSVFNNPNGCERYLIVRVICISLMTNDIEHFFMCVLANLDSVLKIRHYFANRGPYIQNYGVSSSHVWMWELDHKEGWVLRNWCVGTVVLEKTLESPLDYKKIKPVNPRGNQSWIFIRRTDAEAEAPILWPPDVKRPLIGKDPDAGKNWSQKEKRVAEDEMVR